MNQLTYENINTNHHAKHSINYLNIMTDLPNSCRTRHDEMKDQDPSHRHSADDARTQDDASYTNRLMLTRKCFTRTRTMLVLLTLRGVSRNGSTRSSRHERTREGLLTKRPDLRHPPGSTTQSTQTRLIDTKTNAQVPFN